MINICIACLLHRNVLYQVSNGLVFTPYEIAKSRSVMLIEGLCIAVDVLERTLMVEGWDSSVGIATIYRLDSLGVESQ